MKKLEDNTSDSSPNLRKLDEIIKKSTKEYLLLDNKKSNFICPDMPVFEISNIKNGISYDPNQENSDKYFLLISDKFGEISLKPITKEETRESFSKEIKILTGHCDTINYLKLSLNNKLLLSSDNFGKIKIYNFPNIFNVLSVILYHEDEIVYTNFVGENDKGFFVINKAGNIDFWSIYDFVKEKEINLSFLDKEKIMEVKTLNKNEYVIIKTDKKFFVVKIDGDKYEIEKVKEIDNNGISNEEKIENKFLEFNGKIYQVEICLNNYKIKAINDIS